MDILAFKEAFDAFLFKGCLFALAGLSVVFFMLTCGFRKEIEDLIKKTGPFFVVFFFTWAAWAFISSFPTQEEKEEILKAEKEQEEVNKAWGAFFAGGLVSDNVANVVSVANPNSQLSTGNIGIDNWQHFHNGNIQQENSTLQLQLTTTTTLTNTDFERGFVLTRIGTNEVFDFSTPSNAVVCADWLQFGATEDWVYLELGDSSQGLGGERLRVHSDGWLAALQPTSTVFVAKECYPFKTTLGIAPKVNWNVSSQNSALAPNSCPLTLLSCFWYESSLSNTLVVTWQNALYNRLIETPISFQVEYFPNGDFVYRYDLASIRAKLASGNFSENWASNVVIGADSQNSASLLLCDSPLLGHPHSGLASLGGYALKNATLTSLAFHRLESDDSPGSDRDNDGISIEDELFVYRTDPYNADSDYDGLSDYDEIFVHASNPNNPNSISPIYPDGFALALGDIDPFSYPIGSTNTVYEHIFYTGKANAPFVYPESTTETAVLKVTVSGTGSGRLIVGDKVVPLLGSSTGFTRLAGLGSGITNTLLLAVEKGVKKTIWFSKPEGLDVAIDSDDFLIGELPAIYKPRGWIAFPHTQALIPCIHDFKAKGKTLSLVHGEEFSGMTAMWASSASDVVITNYPPCSAEVHANFKKNQTREISYTVNHPNQLNSTSACFVQELRFCPQFSETDEPNESSSSADTEDDYWEEADESLPTISDDAEDMAAFTNIVQSLTSLTDVLYLYRDNVRTIPLEVPEGEPRHCCPCPEHWKSNYVAQVSYTDKVAVSNTDGSEFEISYEPCTVTVSGVSPSKNFKDATVNFITNGVSYKRIDYTVLGVKITRGEYRTPIERYNTLSPTLGFPVEVCNSPYDSASLVLKTDVLPTNGYVKVSLECDSGDFQIWVPGWYDDEFYWHDYEKLLDSDGKTSAYFSMKKWRSLLKRYRERSELEIRIVSSTVGSCKLKLEYIASNGTNYVYDIAEQKITSLNPLLLADYDRDGAIGKNDVQSWLKGRRFRYWVNECRVVGSVWEEPSLFENIIHGIVGEDNWRNSHVDGAYDLINLFPIAVDFCPFLRSWGNDVSFVITSESGEDAFNYTLANISHQSAGSIRRMPTVDFYGNVLTNAPLYELGRDGIVFSKTRALSFSDASCFLIAEAKKSRDGGLRMSVRVNGEELYSSRLSIQTSSVDDMFRFVSIRGAYENPIEVFSLPPIPPNNPDSELPLKDVFFVHGFNVNEDAAKDWNREMFKRFWVSGMNARYWGVTWSGDYHVAFESFNGLHYHRDVRQALMSAPTLRNLVNQHGHDAVVIGHSLGNMVVSEALLKGAKAKTYIMLDAAVASEAYRPQLQAENIELLDKYVPSDWDGYHSRTWAANWYTWFTNNSSDVRGELGWAGHFAPLLENPNLEVYNFYSSGDEVFAEASQVPGLVTGMFHWPTFSLSWPFVDIDFTPDAFPWQKQEVFKGINVAGSLSAGWGFHCWTTNINNEVIKVRCSVAGANALVANGSIVTNAVFDRGVSAMFKPDISDFEKADILAYHIPAVSSPAGKVISIGEKEDDGLDYNLNDETCRENGWGREGASVENETGHQLIVDDWLHSDIKNMAYFFIYPAFEKILEKGNLK